VLSVQCYELRVSSYGLNMSVECKFKKHILVTGCELRVQDSRFNGKGTTNNLKYGGMDNTVKNILEILY